MTAKRIEGKIEQMFNYAICEISGKQFKVTPNSLIKVDFLGNDKEIETAVLLLSEDGKIKVGTPYLKDKLTLKILDTLKGKKIRVAKFHAKANFRKVKGYRSKNTNLIWAVKKA